MGIATRRPPLPAATDSLIESAEDGEESSEREETDLNTDLGTILTHQTIPDDGTPITITTTKHHSGKLKSPGNQSQTSLLIEYFGGGKGSDLARRRPSVRVRVNSASRKKGVEGDGHAIVAEGQDLGRTSNSRKINLGINSESISTLPVVEGPSRYRNGPVEIDVVNGEDSEVSGRAASPEPRFFVPESDISSMPADSLLETQQSTRRYENTGDASYTGSDNIEYDTLKPPPPLGQQSNRSTERITQKVIEKLSNKPRDSAPIRRVYEGSRSRGHSREVLAEAPNVLTKRKITKSPEEGSALSGTASSFVSGSRLSTNMEPIDQRSAVSGASNTSINNPKLLRTVEDAIRRLILPELEELKKEKKHRSHRVKHEREVIPSSQSGSSLSREETARQVSTGSGHRRRRRSSRHTGDDVSERANRRERQTSKNVDYDSPSEESYQQYGDMSSTERERVRRHAYAKDLRLRDATAGAVAGAALTAAALKHHESNESVDQRERRKKRSKSRSSRSASIQEDEEIFYKHDVPPMPFRSETGTDLTRSSLLSSRTGGTATPTQHEVHRVVRGSPHEVVSPTLQSPTRSSIDLKKGLGTHHGNLSERNLSFHNTVTVQDPRGHEEQVEEEYDEHTPENTWSAHGLLTDEERVKAYERNLHQQHPIRRGLSPIQSVASYQTTEPNRNSIMHRQDSDEVSITSRERTPLENERSMPNMSLAQSQEAAKRRAFGISLENRSEIMAVHGKALEGNHVHDNEVNDFYDEQHSQNDRYRDSYASEDPSIDVRRLTNYTDDGVDAAHLYKVGPGQQVAQGYENSAEYVHTPAEVESAVASLVDPSVLDVRAPYSPYRSQSESLSRESLRSQGRGVPFEKRGSPLKEHYSVHSADNVAEDIQDEERSILETPVPTNGTFQAPLRPAPMPTSKDRPDSGDVPAESPESEITTNPSVIQGPIGGTTIDNRDHWPYDATPPRSKSDEVLRGSRDIGAQDNLVPEALAVNRPEAFKPTMDKYLESRTSPSPVGLKDEGYVTADNPPSPGLYGGNIKGGMGYSMPQDAYGSAPMDDPFTTKRTKHMSGMSQGMSPLYDSATGKGMDSIKSKDVVALMDHLTVRDAQRNARDTEILVTLVRTAAEMRNSFEDMKKFIAEQDDLILETTDKQHDKTQKVISGPRPLPPSTRFQRATPSEEEDSSTKRRNVFKRALRGLGSKNSAELTNIEGMLMQLLDDVDSLRGLHEETRASLRAQSTDPMSAENVRAPTDAGYEPEGQAGTSSTSDRYSRNSSRQADYRSAGARRASANRVSTVIEDDEYENGMNGMVDDNQRTPRGSPSREFQNQVGHTNGSQENTPTRYTEENTPNLSSEQTSSRKHKSFTSSFLPKVMSRWSKTTTSSTADNRASQQTRARPYSQASHSGSQLDDYAYDPHGEDRLNSPNSLNQENRPPSPLMPSQISDHPKYQAHRNSLNLQHPQPRQGPTGRYQQTLESEAQNYHVDSLLSPVSETSSHWDNNNRGLNSVDPNTYESYQHGRQLSPISDREYSEASSHRDDYNSYNTGVRNTASNGSMGRNAPPRPPKIVDSDEPLIPQRPPKVPMSPRQSTYIDHVAAARSGSPAFDKSPVNALRSPNSAGRKPSGPRPLSSSGGRGLTSPMATVEAKRTRFRGSPNQIDSDDEVDRY